MAYHFHAGQYDKEFAPRRLRNWEVSRWCPSRARPVHQRPPCVPIADIHGNMFPHVPRGPSGPFGHFVGTWDMPRKITREVAEQLAKQPPAGRFLSWLKPRTLRPELEPKKGKSAHSSPPTAQPAPTHDEEVTKDGHKLADNDQEQPREANPPQETCESTEKTREEETYVWNDVKKPVDSQGNGPYVPGSLTQPEHRHETYDLLVKDATEQIHGPQEPNQDKFWRKVAENAELKAHDSEQAESKIEPSSNEIMRNQHPRNKIQRQDPRIVLPDVHEKTGYHYARKVHMDFLEHQPLPDTLGYRHLTKVGEHRDSDIVVKPYAVGWKGYGASGPTSCTKMRVYRPKTCDPKQSSDKENAEVQKSRPSTSMLDNKKPISRMDLAIGWEYRPQDPAQEPKPPKHIDGSNGSRAPAVFTMVHTPKQEEDFPISSHSNPIFTQNCPPEEPHRLPSFEKDMSKNKRKDSCEVQNCPQHTMKFSEVERPQGRRNSSQSAGSNNSHKSPQCDGIHGCGTPSVLSSEVPARRNSFQSAGSNNSHKSPQCDGIHGCGTPDKISQTSRGKRSERPERLKSINAWNENSVDKPKTVRQNSFEKNGKRSSLESYEKTSLAQGKLHQSSPDVSNGSRSSKDSSCSNNGRHKHCVSCSGGKSNHVEAKPKNDYKLAFKAGNPNSVHGSTNGSTDSKNLKIPKMRDPYAKKSYSIPTLAPPFCIWRDTSNSGYPEHWRLASVYQHAYKPIDQRRKPLIASVYQ